jgi:hypothetical protein
MSVYDRYPFPQDNRPEDREESIKRRRGSSLEHDQHWDMVNFETIGEAADPCSAPVCMCDDDDFVSALDQTLR